MNDITINKEIQRLLDEVTKIYPSYKLRSIVEDQEYICLENTLEEFILVFYYIDKNSNYKIKEIQESDEPLPLLKHTQ